MLKTAWLMDTVGNRGARIEVSAIKVAAPEVATWVIDRAIQAHGGMGVAQDTLLPELYAVARILQIADGPDEVHYMAIARRETRRYRQQRGHGLRPQLAAAATLRRGARPSMRTSVLPTVSPASIRTSASGARSSPSTIVCAVAQAACRPASRPSSRITSSHAVQVAAAAEPAQREVVGGRLEQVAVAPRRVGRLVLRQRAAQRRPGPSGAAQSSAASRWSPPDAVEVDVDPVRRRRAQLAPRPGPPR